MTCRLSLYQFAERLNKRWMDLKYLKCAKPEKKNPDFVEWTDSNGPTISTTSARYC